MGAVGYVFIFVYLLESVASCVVQFFMQLFLIGFFLLLQFGYGIVGDELHRSASVACWLA